jgi:hypothetical protein
MLLAPAVASPRLIEVLAGRDSVPVKPVQSIERATMPVDTVTVFAPLAASKKTSSAAVGTAAPLAPPDVVAHLPVAVAFQVLVPPTQNLLAMAYSV